jgi:hypothetical protein
VIMGAGGAGCGHPQRACTGRKEFSTTLRLASNMHANVVRDW